MRGLSWVIVEQERRARRRSLRAGGPNAAGMSGGTEPQTDDGHRRRGRAERAGAAPTGPGHPTAISNHRAAPAAGAASAGRRTPGRAGARGRSAVLDGEAEARYEVREEHKPDRPVGQQSAPSAQPVEGRRGWGCAAWDDEQGQDEQRHRGPLLDSLASRLTPVWVAGDHGHAVTIVRPLVTGRGLGPKVAINRAVGLSTASMPGRASNRRRRPAPCGHAPCL